MKKNVKAVVVAYNPVIDLFLVSLHELLSQVDSIIVVNNSSYPLEIQVPKVDVINLGYNAGIAKAQSIGMESAFEDGTLFVLQMDQDSTPQKGMVECLRNTYDILGGKGLNVGLVGVQDFDVNTGKIRKAHIIKESSILDGIQLVDTILSSGSLISKYAYDVVGGMDDGLFIDAVDFEYCWRLKKYGFEVVRADRALLAHNLGDGEVKVFGVLSVRFGSSFRHYYQFRNSLKLMTRSYVPLNWKVVTVIKLSVKLVVYPFILKDGFVRFKYMLNGVKDAILGRTGAI